jgi:hypothetical protein
MPSKSQMPEWMKKKQQEMRLSEATEKDAERRKLAAALLIQSESPEFWKRLLDNLKLAVEALATIELTGSYSQIGLNAVRISMNHPDLFASRTHTDLFHETGRIRCTTLGVGAYNLDFHVISETEVGVLDKHKGGSPMNADQASEYVIRRMVDFIERQRRTAG